MSDSLRYKDWIDKARRDLHAARILYENQADEEFVAFHCQQSVEKALKSYIIIKQHRLLESHSLIFLCRQAVKHNEAFRDYLHECAFLNQFYIETRYPADVPQEVTRGQAEQCLAQSEQILDFILPQLGA